LFIPLDGVQVQPNRYLSDLSFSSEGSSGGMVESDMSNRSNMVISTRGESVRKCAVKVQTSSEMMSTQGTSSIGKWLMSQQ